MNDAGSTDESDAHAGELSSSRAGAKRKRCLAALLLCLATLGLGACSTPGPSHFYLYSPAISRTVRDVDPLSGAEISQIPAFASEGEQVVALAYDPFTDHLFLRVFPGNSIRVLDRPANKLKRVFGAPNLPIGGHDFTIRSRDRHFFFTESTAPALIETDLYGELKGYIKLEGLAEPVWGVAHDAINDQLLVLPAQTTDRLLRFSLTGKLVEELKLERPAQGCSLAYDSVARSAYASLADGSAIGVFDHEGRLLRTLSRPSAEREVFFDIGPRSLLRVF